MQRRKHSSIRPMRADISGALKNSSKTVSLDPKTNREEREVVKARNRAEDKPLDPPFPYKRVYFDPFAFDVTHELPRREDRLE
jgi:hypothetical protein